MSLSLVHLTHACRPNETPIFPHSMSSNFGQRSPDPPPTPVMTFPHPSQNASTLPSTGGNLHATIPIYQLNPPATNNVLTPYSHGFGPPQTHANPMQFGDRPAGVRCSPYCSSFLLDRKFFPFRMLSPTMGHPQEAEMWIRSLEHCLLTISSCRTSSPIWTGG